MLQGPVFLGMHVGVSFVCPPVVAVTLLGLAAALQSGGTAACITQHPPPRRLSRGGGLM